MKKYLLAISITIFTAGYASAAPTYGTNMPAKNEFHAGIQTQSVFESKLEGVHGEYHSLRHFVQLSYGVTDWVSLDLKIGTGNLRYFPDTGSKISYASGFAGGYGLRFKIYDENRIRTVCSFQHISVHPPSESAGNDKYEAILDDWEVSLLTSYEFSRMMPYAGIKAGRQDYTYWVNEHDRNRVKSDETNMVGFVLGLDFHIDERAWINIEAQMVDVTALSASMNIRF